MLFTGIMTMRRAKVFFNFHPAGYLTEEVYGIRYVFAYDPAYAGPPVSLTMPVRVEPYFFEEFPAFFDGLLPEGVQLEGLLKQKKIDRDDKFSQLLAVGADTVGAVSVESA
jgi:serine/threonine-protein kinase HipA